MTYADTAQAHTSHTALSYELTKIIHQCFAVNDVGQPKTNTRNYTMYIRLFPLLEPPPFVSAFVSGYRLLTVALLDLFGDCGGLDAFELPLAKI